ncbi:hypothetical protein K8S17_01390 [bacterium]|nr:hypothetical protein [bacterium]
MRCATAVDATAAFEIDVTSAGQEAICRSGPPPELVRMLTASPGSSERRGRSSWEVSATATERYGLPELRGAGALVTRRSAHGALVLGAWTFGSGLYREQTLCAGLSTSWTERLAMGVRVRALCLSWEGGGPEWSLAFDGSLAWLLGGRAVVGLAFGNAAAATVRTSSVASPASVSFGLVLDRVTILGSLDNEPGFDPSPALGAEVALSSWVLIRAGLRADPSSMAFGVRFGAGRRLRPDVDVAWCWHPVLGSSSSLTVSICI